MRKRRSAKKNNVKKTVDKAPDISEKINNEVIAEALNFTNQPVFMKLCRLCESKDGPFLNIFDPDMITAKKIESLMPFVIAENDDLPHKICFRCSAKVEELHEFLQKCTQAQHNLRKVLSSKAPFVAKSKRRDIWEEKLNQSNISNDDICDALIKKAMEGIKDIPLTPFKAFDDLVTKKMVKNAPEKIKSAKVMPANDDVSDEIPLKKVKLQLTKVDSISDKMSLRSTNSNNKKVSKKKEVKEVEVTKKPTPERKIEEIRKTPAPVKTVIDNKTEKPVENPPTTNTCSLSEITPHNNTFNIDDHVSMLKVHGIGTLFQCLVCNRNFLKQEIVMSHACAKNGPSKLAPKTTIRPKPPKIPLVKYINTRINNESMKPINDKPISIDDDDDEDDKPLRIKKSKPKIGPASKVKKKYTNEPSNLVACITNTNVQAPTVQFPALPSLNSRYKLMAGPNNMFTLVEEKAKELEASEKIEITVPPLEPFKNRPVGGPKKIVNATKASKQVQPNKTFMLTSQPYPVGLFKTLPTTSASSALIEAPPLVPVTKKQSYTVVQTGNPSKLLISTKPQAQLPTTRQRKMRPQLQEKEPYSVTLEDEARPKDTEFFTFINVDPLLQPSYVLPTNNIIQESQISTSTNVQNKESVEEPRYTCNMCNETFSREKKLLSHIQSHYNKMDEEDQIRNNNPRKRKK